MDIPIQTSELIITSDGIDIVFLKYRYGCIYVFFWNIDLPQLHVVSYKSKENLLQFDYLPDSSRLSNLNENQLCLNIRQSSDGKLYQSVDECLPIVDRQVQWRIGKDQPFLKLAICSKKHREICGQEIEMKEGKSDLFCFT